MHNPFAKPRTPGQWLLGSGCWLGSCGALGWGLSCLLAEQLRSDYGLYYSLVAVASAQALLWWRVVAAGKPALGPAKGTWLLGLGRCWWLLLQLLLLLLFLGALLAVILAVVLSAASGPWLSF